MPGDNKFMFSTLGTRFRNEQALNVHMVPGSQKLQPVSLAALALQAT